MDDFFAKVPDSAMKLGGHVEVVFLFVRGKIDAEQSRADPDRHPSGPVAHI